MKTVKLYTGVDIRNLGIQMIKLLVIYPIHDGMKVIIKIEMKVKVTLLEI